jgi:hypothetical protein
MFAVCFLITVTLSPVFKPVPRKVLVEARAPQKRLREPV